MAILDPLNLKVNTLLLLFQIAPIVIDSLEYDNKDMLLVTVDVLAQFVTMTPEIVAASLQTILPRLISLSKYMKSMVST